MENLFHPAIYESITARVNQITPDAKPLWGKMNVAQMLAHCAVAFQVPLSDKPLKGNFLLRLIGPFFKAQLYNDKPWKQGLPTAPNFIITDERDFAAEKQNLLNIISRFYHEGEQGISKHPHPIFGRFTPAQWGQAMYKHLDHHLRQFGQ